MASTSRDLRSHVTDVVTCPICLELMNNPKSLPCLHTFCLKCIEGHYRDNEPGAEVPCPVCRQKFDIPAGGVQGLVGNFIIAGLVEARKTMSDVVVLQYCRPHKKFKGEPHNELSAETMDEAELIQIERGKCEKHSMDDVRLYCFDCKMNICLMCFAEEHQQHKCKNVDTVAAECCQQIDADIGTIEERATAARNEISRLDEERRKFVAGVQEVDDKIVKRSEELKQLIDKQANELMAEVRVLKTKKCKEIDSHKEDIEAMLVALESFCAYCSELKSNGKPCDITRAANDLHTRATELLQNDFTPTDYCAPVVTFKLTHIHELLAGVQNFVGYIKAKEMRVARVVHTLSEAEAIFGVTSLDDELYVLRDNDQVDVYSSATTTTTTSSSSTTTVYSLLRHLPVPELKGLTDMTSCKHYRCLYISDRRSKCVHRVELNGKCTQWSVNCAPHRLSVTSQLTVLVTCRSDNRLLELTTVGDLLREINLQSDIVNPWHAIQLSNGQFVVSHGNSADPIHRVCIVDTNGHVTQSYGGPRGSATVGQLDGPIHLAVDTDESVFVADLNNQRVLLLSPTLGFVREVVSRDQLKFKPLRLFLDVDRRCLYVAENELKDGKYTAGRVVVVHI